MFSTILKTTCAALAIAGASAAPVDDADIRLGVFARGVTQQFYLVGNNSGKAAVDGVKLGARPVVNTRVGWGLPYGQKPQVFGYDNSTFYVHAGTTSSGEALVLAAFILPNGNAQVKTATVGESGAAILECEPLASELFCVSEPNGQNHNDWTATPVSPGVFELEINTSRTNLTTINIVPAN